MADAIKPVRGNFRTTHYRPLRSLENRLSADGGREIHGSSRFARHWGSFSAAAALVKEKWGSVDVLVHSVAFANREDLTKRFIETSRDGFATALNVSAYSLTALCHAFEPMLNPGASVLTMTYYGAQKIITNYNVMGVAKAALEASVRYLSVDLGAKDVRINAISAGPLKTLASSGISDFKQIFNHIEEHAPLRRNVTTEDVGKAAVFLASDLGSAVTGEIMFVDCGYNNLGI